MTDQLSAARALVTQEWRVQRRDLSPVVVLTVIPLILMSLLGPLYSSALAAVGGTRGAQYAVPGLAVTFSLLLIGTVGLAFFRDHGWGVWPRLLVSPLPLPLLVLGKLVVPYTILVVQLCVLLGAGRLLFGLRVTGSLLALLALVLALSADVVALGLLSVALCRTVMQLNTASNVLGMTFAGLGGALVPIPLLPAWAATVAPAVPSYWALRGLQSVLSDGAGMADVLPDLAVLAGFAAVVFAVAAVGLRPDQRKQSWA